MHTVMIYDLETTSLNTETAVIQEIGWMVFEVDLSEAIIDKNANGSISVEDMPQRWNLVSTRGMLLSWEHIHDYEVEPEAEATTGISKKLCMEHGVPAQLGLVEFLNDLSEVEWIGGHNVINYDRKVMLSNLARLRAGSDPGNFFEKIPHFDTMLDLPLVGKQTAKKLQYFALDHGYYQPHAHRALADVQACAHICQAYDFQKIIEIARSPLVECHAEVKYGDTVTKDKLYSHGFRWNPETKTYRKTMRECFIPDVNLCSKTVIYDKCNNQLVIEGI